MARYILVDDDSHSVVDSDVDVAAFVEMNALDEYEADAIRDLPRGKARVYGGGAAPQFSLLKVEA
jgi:hypothetical protein